MVGDELGSVVFVIYNIESGAKDHTQEEGQEWEACWNRRPFAILPEDDLEAFETGV